MFYIAIALTLFALLGGMHLLAKTKKEMLGSFFTWVSYIIIAVSFLLLICQATKGILRMACCTSMCPPSEHCMPGMMHGEGHHGWMKDGKSSGEMEECDGKMDKECCKKMKEGHCMDTQEDTKEDSLKK